MFDEYIHKYGNRLLGLCLKLCTSHQDSEDLYQETWIKAYKYYSKYDRTKEFEGWLTTICVNTYKDMLRKQKYQMLFHTFHTNEEKDSVMYNIPSREQAQVHDDVQQAVNELSDKYRTTIILYYYNDLDIKRTAQILDIPEGTVKYRLHKAREFLKRRLEANG